MPVQTGFAFLDEPRRHGGIVAMAHRGGAGHPDLVGLENTLEAFRHACDLGFRYLETDVQTTADGHLLAFHDTSVERITDASGRISELTLEQVRSIRIARRAGIPLLEELLEELPDARLNIDLKSPSTVGPTVEVLRRTKAHDRVCVGSFQEPTLRRFRRAVGRPVATTTGIALVAALKFAPYPLALSRLLRDRGAVLQVPVRHRGMRVVDRRLLELAHASGRHLHVWTVDERSEIERLLDMGVDGIITDRTDVLAEVLRERGIWSSQR